MCFLQNISLIRLVVLEKKIFKGFFTIFGHGGHLEFRIKTILAIFRSPSAWMLHIKFGYIWPSGFRGEVV